jgi:diguanylate cyclase (GGDEF)-like protein
MSFPIHKILRTQFKRAFDFIAALITLLILSPFFAIIAILIKRDSPGPVFYWGHRLGKGERQFRMLKFRTMYECSDSYQGPSLTCKEDKRITPFGRWLRDTKINELPQFWNVLKGEMSVVGPRPEDPGIALDWPEAARREVLSVRPGITSPASILYHDEEHLLSQTDLMGNYFNGILPDKLRLDQLYVRNQTFFSDLDIIFWTAVIFIPRLAKAKISEGYLFAGPISRVTHRYISWFLLDLFTMLFIVGIANLLWRSQAPLNWGVDNLVILAILLAFLFSGVNSILGLNRIVWSRATIEDETRIAISSGIVTFLILALNHLQFMYHWLPFPPLPVAMIFTIGMMAMLGFTVIRFRWRLLTSLASRWLTLRKNSPGVGERILIVGAGDGCDTATWLLKHQRFSYAYNIVGIIDDDIPTKHGMLVNGCKVLGRVAELQDLVKKYDVGLVLVTTRNIHPEFHEYIRNLCQNLNARLVFLDNLMGPVEQQLGQHVTTGETTIETNGPSGVITLYDIITGLPNRFLLQERLKHSLAYTHRYKTQLAVMMIDLDGHIPNDQSPRCKPGDDALKEVARRLIHCIRESDTIARLDGHEFALILEDVSDQRTAEIIARRISNAISKPYHINGTEFVTSAKIGMWLSTDGVHDSEPLNAADMEISSLKKRMVEFPS